MSDLSYKMKSMKQLNNALLEEVKNNDSGGQREEVLGNYNKIGG